MSHKAERFMVEVFRDGSAFVHSEAKLIPMRPACLAQIITDAIGSYRNAQEQDAAEEGLN